MKRRINDLQTIPRPYVVHTPKSHLHPFPWTPSFGAHPHSVKPGCKTRRNSGTYTAGLPAGNPNATIKALIVYTFITTKLRTQSHFCRPLKHSYTIYYQTLKKIFLTFRPPCALNKVHISCMRYAHSQPAVIAAGWLLWVAPPISHLAGSGVLAGCRCGNVNGQVLPKLGNSGTGETG